MKIVIISPSLDPAINVSGISTVVNTIITHGRHEYLHYTFGSPSKSIGKKDLAWIWRLLKSFYGYFLFIRKHNPDLVHMNAPCGETLRESVILAINSFYKKKSLLHLHGGQFLMQKQGNALRQYLFKRLLKKSAKAIVLSRIEKESLEKLYGYADAEVIHNSIDTLNVPYKIFENTPNRKIQILFLGRIEKGKGIYEIQKAFALLYAEMPFKFIICGSDCSKDNIIIDFQKLMNHDFCYKGIVAGADKTHAIFDSDIFILPSHLEGLPISLLETMAMGVVPVVTPVGSIPDVVKDGYNGILVDKYNPEDICLKLKELFNHPEKLRELSIHARQTIVETFDVKPMLEKLERIYNDCFLAEAGKNSD